MAGSASTSGLALCGVRLVSRHLVRAFTACFSSFSTAEWTAVNRSRAGPQPHQLVVEVVDGGFGVMHAALQRQNHVGFALAPAVQQLADLGEVGLQISWPAPAPVPLVCPYM